MSLTTLVLAGLGILTVFFSVIFIKDLVANKDNFEKETSFGISAVIGAVVNFFDTLGIGSFAPLTALLRGFKQVEDRIIPGTLNVSCTIPVITEAFAFIQSVEVEPITLGGMLISAAAGAYLGAGIVSKLPTKKIQITVAFALLATGIIMGIQMTPLFPGGGEAYGLTGIKLVIGIAANFVLGALMTAGIGLYAPCMALVYLLGMSPLVAFPIMMGSCAYLMPVASAKFVKEGAYNRKASLAITLGGIVGVLIAVFIVKSLPLKILKILVICVMFYTAYSLLQAAKKIDAGEAA